MKTNIQRWFRFVPIVVLPAFAFTLRPDLSNWAFMWAVGFSIYAGCKWLTYCKALEKGASPTTLLSLGYLLLWLGMDAQAFFDRRTKVPKPSAKTWFIAIINTASGALLLWDVARLVPPHQTLLAGWIGVFGLLLFLFFGVFHIFALIWQWLGINARHMMNSPILATSLTNFWSARWNLPVHQLAYDFVFRPSVHSLGIAGATFMTFLASGLAHELITSVPAGAGYGLPVTYFVLQFFGVFLERSNLGKKLDLGRGLKGWLFTFTFTACPFFLLFHPPFVARVIVPFMHRIHAL